jgi:hypothetical protein
MKICLNWNSAETGYFNSNVCTDFCDDYRDLPTLPILGSEALKLCEIVTADGPVRVLHGCEEISQCNITGHNLQNVRTACRTIQQLLK